MRLLNAVSIGQIGVVRAFIAEGDDVNESSESGNCPFLEAASRNDTPMMKLLLEKGANPDVYDMGRNTPLAWAKRYNNVEMEEMINTVLEKQSLPNMAF